MEVDIARGPSRYFNDNEKWKLLLCLKATRGHFWSHGERLLLCILEVPGSKPGPEAGYFFPVPQYKCRDSTSKWNMARLLSTPAFLTRRKLLSFPILKFTAELCKPFHNLTIPQSKLLVTLTPARNVSLKFQSSFSFGGDFLHKDWQHTDPVWRMKLGSGIDRAVPRPSIAPGGIWFKTVMTEICLTPPHFLQHPD
jgi:hypothetical protein